MTDDLEARITEIADQVEPRYRSGRYSCTSHVAKLWQAAWDGARAALERPASEEE